MYFAHCSPIAAFKLAYIGSRSTRGAVVAALGTFENDCGTTPDFDGVSNVGAMTDNVDGMAAEREALPEMLLVPSVHETNLGRVKRRVVELAASSQFDSDRLVALPCDE